MNDTEQRIRAALRTLGEKDSPTATEIQQTLSTPALPRRSRREAMVVAAAVIVVAAALGLGLAVGPLHHDGPATPSTVAVGRGRAVVDVPGSWTRNDGRCGTPMSDTVMITSGVIRPCKVIVTPGYDSVTISFAHGRLRGSGTTYRTITGEPLYEHRTTKGGYTTIDLTLPKEDAWFRIRTHDPRRAQTIADSLRILPPTLTTVPDVSTGASGGLLAGGAFPTPKEVTRRLTRAHLVPRFDYTGTATAHHFSQITSEPQAGEVVPTGSVVTVTYSSSS